MGLILAPALLAVALASPSHLMRLVEASGQTATEAPGDVARAPIPPAESNQGDKPDKPDKPDTSAEDPDDAPPPTPPHTGVRAVFRGLKDDIAHLPSKENLYIAGIGGGLALGAHSFDQRVNAQALNHYEVVNEIFEPAQYYGSTAVQLGLSIGTWAAGRALHKPKVSHLGMDLLRAQALSVILVTPIKFATGRNRPDGSNHQSFPSGHAAITFAAAAVIERHLGWRNSIVAFAVASYVAASRLHDNRHYLSDVVFGAALGSIAGRTVSRHGRDTWTLTPIAASGGMGIAVTRTGF